MQAGENAWSIARLPKVSKLSLAPYSRGLPPGSPPLITPYLCSALLKHSSTAFNISAQLASSAAACSTKTSTYHCPSLYFGFATDSDFDSVHIAVFWTDFSTAAPAESECPSRKERVRSL